IAVGMAAGYAAARRYRKDSDTPPLGVVNLHALGGLAHGLGNLYGAARSNVPLLVTAGAQATNFRHKEPILTGDMVGLTDEFTKFSQEVLDAEALPVLLRRAVRTALSPPMGPVFLSLPLDVMEQPLPQSPLPLGDLPEAGSCPDDKLTQLKHQLTNAESPIFVLGDSLGRGGHQAVSNFVDVIETTGSMAFGEILAAECNFPTSHPQWMSFLPPDADLVSELLDTDLVILVGCSSNAPLFRDGSSLIPESTTCVQIHSDPLELGKNERTDLTLYGDFTRIGTKLADSMEGETAEEVRENRLKVGEDVSALIDARFQDYLENDPKPDRCSKPDVVEVLEAEVNDFFLVDEGVTGRYALLQEWPMEPEKYLSNKGGSLGYGLPASIGVSLALDRDDNARVLAYVGDGSFWYYPQSLYTAARRNLPITFLVLNNRGYSILKDKLKEFYDHTSSSPGMDLRDISSPEAAQSQGIESRTVNDKEGLREALQSQKDLSNPGLIEVLVHD
ncbi:MAG: thiamine pyrophosphate-binding protein, partial [bacterium]